MCLIIPPVLFFDFLSYLEAVPVSSSLRLVLLLPILLVVVLNPSPMVWRVHSRMLSAVLSLMRRPFLLLRHLDIAVWKRAMLTVRRTALLLHPIASETGTSSECLPLWPSHPGSGQ